MGVFVGFVAVIAVIAVLMIAAERRRIRGVFASLEGRGFAVNPKPGKEEAQRFFEPLDGLSHLRTGAAGLKWLARGRIARWPAVVLEHSYTIGTGKNRRSVVHTCAALVGDGRWPVLTLTGETLMNRLAERLGGKSDVKLEDEAFNRRWRVNCHDEGFALAMLTPEVQGVLGGSGLNEWWVFGGQGLVCLGRVGAPSARGIEGMLARLDQVASAMAPEAREGLGLESGAGLPA